SSPCARADRSRTAWRERALNVDGGAAKWRASARTDTIVYADMKGGAFFPMVMLRIFIAPIVLVLAIASASQAQEWPNRPIRFIVPFPAGGSTDVAARVI